MDKFVGAILFQKEKVKKSNISRKELKFISKLIVLEYISNILQELCLTHYNKIKLREGRIVILQIWWLVTKLETMKDLTPESDNENSLGVYIAPEDAMPTDTTSSDDISETLNLKIEPDIQINNQMGLPFVGPLCYLPFDQNTQNILAFSVGNQQSFNRRRKRSSRSRYELMFCLIYFRFIGNMRRHFLVTCDQNVHFRSAFQTFFHKIYL